MSGSSITAVEAVPEDGTFLFTVRASDRPGSEGDRDDESEDDDQREAILLRTGTGVACWLNYCRHFTDVRLDKGSGAPTREGEVVCANHGAMFDRDSGLCTFGPCKGAYLNGIDVVVENGEVYLDDPDYEFVAPGPIERDPADLSSGPVEF
ncbi:(2Fe-2S)-binding protein [Halobacteriales archaeon QH_8_64_26]|nr:MAG: (2Fe-2S)-binding protein [Halobacteriales archaeon QH_8_64_26]